MRILGATIHVHDLVIPPTLIRVRRSQLSDASREQLITSPETNYEFVIVSSVDCGVRWPFATFKRTKVEV
jgi:hypothetical protein